MHSYHVTRAVAADRQAALFAEADAARLARSARAGSRPGSGLRRRRPLLRLPRGLRRGAAAVPTEAGG
jgi:hypothetical protein